MPVLTILAAVIVGIMSAARLTRLVTQDSFPPAAWARITWDRITNDGPWSTLFHCHWCFAPYATAVVLVWGWLTDLQPAWWLVNGWLAASYVASMVVERDEVGD